MLEPFYGEEKADHFRMLLTEHIQIGGELVNASKDHNQKAADCIRKKWYANSDKIAKFLACINPCRSESTWRDMLYDHLKMTEKEAALRLQGCYEKDIEIFDKIESEALFLGVMRWAVFNIPMLFILNKVIGMYGLVWSQLLADILTVALSFYVHRRFIKKENLNRESTQSFLNKNTTERPFWLLGCSMFCN